MQKSAILLLGDPPLLGQLLRPRPDRSCSPAARSAARSSMMRDQIAEIEQALRPSPRGDCRRSAAASAGPSRIASRDRRRCPACRRGTPIARRPPGENRGRARASRAVGEMAPTAGRPRASLAFAQRSLNCARASLQRDMRTHHARHRIAVGDPDPAHPQPDRLADHVARDATRRAGTNNWSPRPVRRSRSREHPVDIPVGRRLAVLEQAVAEDPKPPPAAVLDAVIIARRRLARRPPRRGDPFRALGARDIVQRAAPAELGAAGRRGPRTSRRRSAAAGRTGGSGGAAARRVRARASRPAARDRPRAA